MITLEKTLNLTKNLTETIDQLTTKLCVLVDTLSYSRQQTGESYKNPDDTTEFIYGCLASIQVDSLDILCLTIKATNKLLDSPEQEASKELDQNNKDWFYEQLVKINELNSSITPAISDVYNYLTTQSENYSDFPLRELIAQLHEVYKANQKITKIVEEANSLKP